MAITLVKGKKKYYGKTHRDISRQVKADNKAKAQELRQKKKSGHSLTFSEKVFLGAQTKREDKAAGKELQKVEQQARTKQITQEQAELQKKTITMQHSLARSPYVSDQYGQQYKGAVVEDKFIGVKQPEKDKEGRSKTDKLQEQAMIMREIQKRRAANVEKGFFSIDPKYKSDKEIKQISKSKSDKLVEQFSLRQALPTTTAGIPLDKEVKLTFIETPPRELTKTEKTIEKISTPVDVSKVPVVKDLQKNVLTLNAMLYSKEIRTAQKEQQSEKAWLRSIGKSRELSANLVYRDYVPTVEKEIRTPSTWIAAALVSGTSKAAGGIFKRLPISKAKLSPKVSKWIPRLFTGSYVGYQGKRVLTKEVTLGEALGEATAFGVAYNMVDPAIDFGAKIFKDAVKLQASVLTGTTIGGRSAKARSGRKSKAQIRKNSMQQRKDHRVFQDTQTGERGIRVRSPKLKKEQFTKERVLRFKTSKGKASLTSVKDTLTGGRGSVTTMIRSGKSFTGKGTTPGWRKSYPKGWGSQSVSYPSSYGDTLGVTLIKRSQAMKFPKQPATKWPKQKYIPAPKYTGKGAQSLSIKSANPFEKLQPQQTVVTPTETGGFRKGQRDLLYSKLQAQILERERSKFIVDLSGLTGGLPAFKTKINVEQPLSIAADHTNVLLFPKLDLNIDQAQKTKLKADTGSIFKISTSMDQASAISQAQAQAVTQAQAQAVEQAQAQKPSQIFKQVTAVDQEIRTTPKSSPILKVTSAAPTVKITPVLDLKPLPISKKIGKEIIEPPPPFIEEPIYPVLPTFQKREPRAARPPTPRFFKQPKAYTPTLKDIIVQNVGTAKAWSITTGLGSRPIKKKKKKKRK